MSFNKKIMYCIQEDRNVKCSNCEYIKRCNYMIVLEEKIEEKKEEEKKRKCKCFKCVWAHKDTLYCPFSHCIEERGGKWKLKRNFLCSTRS